MPRRSPEHHPPHSMRRVEIQSNRAVATGSMARLSHQATSSPKLWMSRWWVRHKWFRAYGGNRDSLWRILSPRAPIYGGNHLRPWWKLCASKILARKQGWMDVQKEMARGFTEGTRRKVRRAPGSPRFWHCGAKARRQNIELDARLPPGSLFVRSN
jgi:hypothetical protein